MGFDPNTINLVYCPVSPIHRQIVQLLKHQEYQEYFYLHEYICFPSNPMDLKD